MLAGAAAQYIGCSRAVSEYYARQGVPADRLRVIPNGIYWNGAVCGVPFSRTVPVVRSCGRLVPQKGFDVLVRAAAILKGQGVRFRCEIIGAGPERENLETLARRLAVDDIVDFPGATDDARELIADSDIFVLPSYTEGLPLVILEAMHSARPIVTTNLPGLKGVINHGQEGVVVEMGSPKAVAKGRKLLFDDTAAAVSLGRAARARAKSEFTIERTAASYLEAYGDALERTHR